MDANSSAVRRALPARGGVGLKPEHFRSIVENWPDVGFFEVHAENYMVAGGPFHRYLTRIRERYALSIHGVGLSIGGAEPPAAAHLDRLVALLDRYQPESFSEHLAWSTHGGTYFNDLLPVAYDRRTLEKVCAHIDQVQARLKRTLLLENPATYVEFAESTMSEADFITEVLRRTGCGLLLDVNNAYVSCTNHGRDPLAYIEALPLDRVGEIHLAGFAVDADTSAEPLLIDSHGAPVAQTVWELYRETLARVGPMATLIERDSDIPAFDVLAAEAQRAEALMRLPPSQLRIGVPPRLTFRRSADPARGFAIHRNNFAVSLIEALADAYPVVQALVGEEFFRAMAREFAFQHPPRSPVMAEYGGGIAEFIASFPPAASLPFLADVARLEWLYVQAFHAAEAEPMSTAVMSALLADESALPETRFTLHPSLGVLDSRYAVASIWAAHQAEGDMAPIVADRQESVVVVRRGEAVEVVRVPPATAHFIDRLRERMPLAVAVASAQEIDPGFDPGEAFALLIARGVIADIDIENEGEQHDCRHALAA